ncbi:MAG TPA: hypothetical protein VK829_13050 [Terriglobales bacterium]|jgi:hypothetical protein|nr:hypothetical protein [Terriglobales bacterium]
MGVGGYQRVTLTMPMSGKSGRNLILPPRPAEEGQVPFVMELARPRKMRFELKFNGQIAVQVFDDTNG